MVKEDISIKQKGIYYPPEIKYLEFDTEPHILAGSDPAETNNGSANAGTGDGSGFDEDFFGPTKSHSYDPAWGDDEE